MEGRSHEFRKRVVASLEHLNTLFPKVTNHIVRDALLAYLHRPAPAPSKIANESAEDSKPGPNKQPRYLTYLSATASFADDVEPTTREELLSDLVIVGHHPKICKL